MNDLRIDEVHTIFLDQVFSFIAELQKRISREVCFSSVLAQITDTQDRLRHLHHMEVVLFQVVSDLQPDLTLSVLLECLFFRPNLGVELIRLISEESTLRTTWGRQ